MGQHKNNPLVLPPGVTRLNPLSPEFVVGAMAARIGKAVGTSGAKPEVVFAALAVVAGQFLLQTSLTEEAKEKNTSAYFAAVRAAMQPISASPDGAH